MFQWLRSEKGLPPSFSSLALRTQNWVGSTGTQYYYCLPTPPCSGQWNTSVLFSTKLVENWCIFLWTFSFLPSQFRGPKLQMVHPWDDVPLFPWVLGGCAGQSTLSNNNRYVPRVKNKALFEVWVFHSYFLKQQNLTLYPLGGNLETQEDFSGWVFHRDWLEKQS